MLSHRSFFGCIYRLKQKHQDMSGHSTSKLLVALKPFKTCLASRVVLQSCLQFLGGLGIAPKGCRSHNITLARSTSDKFRYAQRLRVTLEEGDHSVDQAKLCLYRTPSRTSLAAANSKGCMRTDSRQKEASTIELFVPTLSALQRETRG